jgi:hypothetical protein
MAYKLRLSLPLNYFLVLKSYLHSRRFLVKAETEYAELFPVNAGTPQGSHCFKETAIQYWFKKWRIKVNGPKLVNATFATWREMCPPPPSPYKQENVKNLRLHLDRRLTWHKHIFAQWKQLGITLTRMNWLLGQKSQLSTRTKLLGYGFHFQHRNSRTLLIKSFANDSGRTLVCTEYGYPKESPITTPPLRSQYIASFSAHPNDLLVNLMEQPDNNRWLRRHLPNDLLTRFLV